MRKKGTISQLFLILLFLLIISSAYIQGAFHILKPLPNTENRQLHAEPVFDISSLDKFPNAYDAYFNDSFEFRNHYLKLYSALNYKYFNKCPFPDKVILGENRTMFLVDKELPTYMCTDLFTDKELSRIQSEFTYRKNYLSKRNSVFYVVICPTKYSVYPELLPFYVKAAGTVSRTDQFIKSLTDIGIQVIDLRKTMVLAKDSVQDVLYMPTDNHWNNNGAFIAYREVMRNIRIKFPLAPVYNFDDYQITPEKREGGNLANMLTMQKELTDVKFNYIPKFKSLATSIKTCPYPIPEKFPYPSEYFVGYEMQGITNIPKVLILSDSFGKLTRDFFKDSFSRTVYIWDEWKYKLNEPIVEYEKPDIYVCMVLESLLKNLSDNCQDRADSSATVK